MTEPGPDAYAETFLEGAEPVQEFSSPALPVIPGAALEPRLGRPGEIGAAVFSIDPPRFNDEAFIEGRVEGVPKADRGALRTTLRYLYLDDGPLNLMRDRRLAAEPYLDAAERVLVRWLATRTNGSERRNYGSLALRAARSSRYRCQRCGCADVRVLNLDHVEGRVDGAAFACLCANCHTLKSRERDWSGGRRQAKA